LIIFHHESRSSQRDLGFLTKKFEGITQILHTVLADVSAICNTQRASDDIEFTISYFREGKDGFLTVSVISGSVVITNRDGFSKTLAAGEETSLQSIIPYSSWVLPIDNDRIYAGQENLFVWTAYPGAAGYILEYNLPTPYFSENNSSKVEFQHQMIILRPDDYSEYDDMVLFNVYIGEIASKIVAEVRIFAIDATGDLISHSISSDKVLVNWE